MQLAKQAYSTNFAPHLMLMEPAHKLFWKLLLQITTTIQIYKNINLLSLPIKSVAAAPQFD